jgi:hypothetical protein
MPIGNNEFLLAAVCKNPSRALRDAGIIQLLSFRSKSILAGDQNDKNSFSNSPLSNILAQKLLRLFHVNRLEISAPQCPTNYTCAGNGDLLDIVVHQNIRVSDVIVSDNLDSDHLKIIFYTVDRVKLGISRNPLKNSKVSKLRL